MPKDERYRILIKGSATMKEIISGLQAMKHEIESLQRRHPKKPVELSIQMIIDEDQDNVEH